jgi:hypothetical protein
MKNVIILGNSELPKIPIYSFLIRKNDKYLHLNYVGKLLNDLFGIQSRAG